MVSLQQFSASNLQTTFSDAVSSVATTLGLNSSEFDSFSPQDEDLSEEFQRIQEQADALLDLDSGHVSVRYFVHKGRDLIYVITQDAAGVNHLCTLKLQDDHWLKTDEVLDSNANDI